MNHYRTISLSEVKDLSSKGGYNSVGKVIYEPILYLVLKNGNGYTAFEVRSIVYNEPLDQDWCCDSD